MNGFSMKICGLTMEIEPMFCSTKEYFKKYLSCEPGDSCVTVTRENLAYEQRMLDLEAEQEGLRFRKFTDPFLERASIQRRFADALIRRNVLLMHASAIAVDGRAYLFTAPTGTGKSTHTRLWRRLFGDGAVMVNDDKPFLEITGGGVLVYGSPWSGKHGLDSNICVPLEGICILRRGAENRICRAEPTAAFALLKNNAYAPDSPEGPALRDSLVDLLAGSVRVWEMECNMDVDAARTSYEAMSAGVD